MLLVNATPLDATVISEMLPTHILNELDIVVLDIVGSTNDVVRERVRAGGCRGMVAFAEQQTAGRGRRGKSWHSPAGANIYCSVGWQCQGALASLSGLSLAVGAILAESVAAHLGIQLQLKWPNDLFYQERKLGGVLVELLGEQDGGHNAVIGFGLNVSMGRDDNGMIGRPWTDLATASGSEVDRNLLAAIFWGSWYRASPRSTTRACPNGWRHGDTGICFSAARWLSMEPRPSRALPPGSTIAERYFCTPRRVTARWQAGRYPCCKLETRYDAGVALVATGCG